MFADPTINDFMDNIRWHLDKALGVTQRLHRSISKDFMENPAYRESLATDVSLLDEKYSNRPHDADPEEWEEMRSFHQSRVGPARAQVRDALDEVRKRFDAAIDVALGELQRTAIKTKLDRQELWQATVQCLTDFAIVMKSAAIPDHVRFLIDDGIEQRFQAFDDHLKFRLRQFYVGIFVPHEPEVPTVSNAININSMTNSVVQQGSPGATQNVTMKVDEAKAAIAAIEAHAGSLGLPADKLSDLQNDIDTIKAQLAKTTPSHSILGEAARSVRDVVQGAMKEVLTPAITGALAALGKATGAY